ncbi:MAG TPA: hypothetical protein VEY91_12865 [Candidatus Limnocylindria bacterium]|nr:hypothetical protein [Candidatus Limnocylindria bacterium]
MPASPPSGELATEVAGRYAIFFNGQPCGEERWRIASSAEGLIVTGEQEMVPPHPFPNRQAYRAVLTREWRATGLEIQWTVGERRLVATHHADLTTWRARIEYQDHVKEQEGDYPNYCEVEYVTHLFNSFILAKRDFQLGGEHEFPVLRIGPPYMAVTPERMLYRCVELGTWASPLGPLPAKRYVVSLTSRGEDEGYTFWADEHDVVLESYEGLDPSRPWMRLVEYRRGT